VRRPAATRPAWLAPRALLAQGLLLAGVLAGLAWLAGNAGDNLARRGITFGFGFLGQTAGFDIPFRLIDWAVTDSYGRALVVVLLNTALVSALAVVAATALGLGLGIMRLAGNWLARTTALVVIELVRNTPQLLQIIFWYVAVLQTLPQMRQSLVLGDGMFLNIRGLFLPAPVAGPWTGWALAGLALALLAAPLAWRLARRAGRAGPWALLLPAAALALLALSLAGWSRPVLQGFNFTGGLVVPPELVALWAGLAIYGAAFIAEIVRGSIEGIPRGQTEAAASLGLPPQPILWLVVLPQALRIMIPQLTSQYLNLIKSSSLGAAIAYPEIVQIFAGTVLNQSGRAIEVMVIVMAVFLAINLAAAAAMARLDARAAIRER
jgi:general L-amino acid transport system permease protein